MADRHVPLRRYCTRCIYQNVARLRETRLKPGYHPFLCSRISLAVGPAFIHYLSSGNLSPLYRLVSESCFVRTCPGERIPGTMVSEDVSRIRDCLPLFESSLEPSVVRCQSITWSVLEERGSPIASGHDSKYGSVQINARESMVSHLEPILAPTLLISPPASTNEKR
jgi:hypothetical protein